MKYVILGCNGQLGKEFSKLFKTRQIDFIGFDLPSMDIFNYSHLNQTILKAEPDVVINCTAYNHVDIAEINYEEAYRVNVVGVENIAKICNKNKIKLIHYSSDYIFSGKKRHVGLYHEDDIPEPLSNYGKSKLEGEQILQKYCEHFLIFRLSWLYGDGEQNFVFKALKWAKEKEIVKIADDEFSVPTSTRLVSTITLQAINNGLNGLFHLANTGYASRLEWAAAVYEMNNLKTIIHPAKMADFALLAKRPTFSAMSNDKISDALKINIPHWRDELLNFFNMQKKEYTEKNKQFKELLHIERGF